MVGHKHKACICVGSRPRLHVQLRSTSTPHSTEEGPGPPCDLDAWDKAPHTGGFHYRNGFSSGWKSRIKVWAGLVPLQASLLGTWMVVFCFLRLHVPFKCPLLGTPALVEEGPPQ